MKEPWKLQDWRALSSLFVGKVLAGSIFGSDHCSCCSCQHQFCWWCTFPTVNDTQVTLSHRPQPPALPHQRRGGDALPDGGCHNWHDVAESRAGCPGRGALLPRDCGGAPPQPPPQPEHHWNFQRLVAVETLPQTLSEDAVRAHVPAPTGWALQRKGLFFFFNLSWLQLIQASSSQRFFNGSQNASLGDDARCWVLQ